MGKQNLQAKKVYWFGIGIFRLSTVLLMTENSNERKDIVQQVSRYGSSMISQISREGGIPVISSVLASLHNGLTSSVKENKQRALSLVYLETT